MKIIVFQKKIIINNAKNKILIHNYMDKTILIKIVKHLKLYLNSNYIYSLIYIYIKESILKSACSFI